MARERKQAARDKLFSGLGDRIKSFLNTEESPNQKNIRARAAKAVPEEKPTRKNTRRLQRSKAKAASEEKPIQKNVRSLGRAKAKKEKEPSRASKIAKAANEKKRTIKAPKAQDPKPVGKGLNLGKAEKTAKDLGKKADTVAKKSKEVLAGKPKAPPKPPPKAKADMSTTSYKDFKTIAAAKKAGSLYYDKGGKKMAAVTKDDLDKSGLSLRDYINQKEGKKRSGKFITASEKMDKPNLKMPKMKGGGTMNTKMSTKGGMRGGGMAMSNPRTPPQAELPKPKPTRGRPLPNRTATNVVMGPRGPKKMQGGGMTKGYQRGGLKKPTADQKGLKKLPTEVRNNMGYMKAGGMTTKGYAKGGPAMSTKGGMKGGGMATKGNTKGGAKKTTGKGKVRGAGIAKRGVRPAKMR